MRDDPGIDEAVVAAHLAESHGIDIAAIRFLPIGYDPNAFVYRVETRGGDAFFLKLRAGAPFEPGLVVPRALIDCGVPNVLAPLPTRTGALWQPVAGAPRFSAVLYPFIRGENAMIAGLSEAQWRTFGATLRAVHDSGLQTRFRDDLRNEDFALPSAALVREVGARAERGEIVAGPAAARFAAFWRGHAAAIDALLIRAQEIGRSLRGKPFERVLCHADIHAANIIAGDDGRIWLIDWDGPLIAPRERDLLFVVGSRIARTVTPEEEGWFFAGYGLVEIDHEALIYYRYERIVEDLGEFGKSVLATPYLSESSREEDTALAMSFFGPDGDIARAELVARSWV
ncbi:MAG: phosphotransferase [Thermomicrobiales bacterium]|nr:phosphotransferase [Thermomicrobiales bacterium]